MKNKFISIFLAVCILDSCTVGDVRDAVGINRNAPDEFMVMPREKLKVPESAVALPKPTEKVEGHIAASENAREALFGKADAQAPQTALEKSLIARTGADKADDSIRKTVNEEYKDKEGVFGTERGGFWESMLDPFGYNAPKEPVVDAKKENKRIKEALAKGEKIDTKSIKTKDPRKEKWKSHKDEDGAAKPVMSNAPDDLTVPDTAKDPEEK